MTREHHQLTPRQRAFVQEYLVDLNATQAALRAGYSERTANVQGPRLLVKVHVAAAIEKAAAARARRTEVTADRVVEELARIAFATIGNVVQWDGSGTTIQPSEELSDDAIRALSEVTDIVTKDGDRTLKVKQYDKIRALELLGKHLGLIKGGDLHINIDNRRLTIVEWFEQRQAERQGGPS